MNARAAMFWCFLLLGNVCLPPSAWPQTSLEFETDRHTLLLAHFEESSRHADYSIGWNRFAGNGAGLTAGYYGRGINLTFPQFHNDFLKTGDAHRPQFTGWGFQPKGIVDYRQGTLEFWFKLPPDGMKRFPLVHSMLECPVARNVKRPGDEYYSSFHFEVNPYECQYLLPFVAGDYAKGRFSFRDIKGFGRYLDREQWHHLALCWSPGEIIAWLDGRPLASHDMTGTHGFALVANAGSYLYFSNIVLDELRVSNNVRYPDTFEPRWRDGKRPDYAFTGNPDVKRFLAKLEEPHTPQILPATGRPVSIELAGIRLRFAPGTDGLLLWEGLGRQLLMPGTRADWKRGPGFCSFTQNYAGQARVSQRLTEQHGAIRWEVTLKNLSDRELWLEYLLSLPVPMARVSEFFDGAERQTKLHFPRWRDVYDSTLPFAAAAGDGVAFGVGIDPHRALNDVITQWIPRGRSGTIRQGSRVALSPGEEFKVAFLVVKDRADFGALDAVAAYHALSPDLYALRPDVPVYSYLPANAEMQFYPFPDQARLCYVGGLWGHGPGHTDGDEFGNPDWWDNPKFYDDPSYKHARGAQASYHTLARLRQHIVDFYRREFDNHYPVCRRHACPDLTPAFIVRELWPGYTPNEDPLGMGQYYGPLTGAWMVNEHETPLGRFFIDSLGKFSRAVASYSPGWINDMSYIPNLRYNDPLAQRTNGRSFSRDLGTFVRGAMGRAARYEAANELMDRGHRMSFWSDGGWHSYTLSAYSSANAIEGGEKYRGLYDLELSLAAGRYLCGEKPFTVLASSFDDWIGSWHAPEDFGSSARTVRDYYRYCDERLALFCLKHGVTGSCLYEFGHQSAMELTPLIVESTVLGRKLVPAARVAEPLWVRRAGDGMQSLLVVGNETPTTQTTDVEVVDRYFGGAPLFGTYLGGSVTHGLGGGVTRLKDIAIGPRAAEAFKILAVVRHGGRASAATDFSGDGLTLNVRIELDAGSNTELQLSAFAPLYRIARVRVNGQPATVQPLNLRKGKSVIEATYANRVLQFTKEDWDAAELIKDGKTNFRLAADKGLDARWDFGSFSAAYPSVGEYPFGFERGTAMFLSDFIFQYDEEDGVLGNLDRPAFVDKTSRDNSQWTVLLQQTPQDTGNCRVRIERATKAIFIEGATQGEMRRAMVVFMRLVDRKYPHIGRFMGLRGFYAQPFVKDGAIQWNIWRPRTGFAEFMQKLDDPQWVLKPLLREEHEPLYANGNMDFAGKYRLKTSPYLFEPTFPEDFVYGYAGTGRAANRTDNQTRTMTAPDQQRRRTQ